MRTLLLLYPLLALAQGPSYNRLTISPSTDGLTLGRICIRELSANGTNCLNLTGQANVAADRTIAFQGSVSHTVAGLETSNTFTGPQTVSATSLTLSNASVIVAGSTTVTGNVVPFDHTADKIGTTTTANRWALMAAHDFNTDQTFTFTGTSAPPLSSAGQSLLYYKSSTGKVQISENGGAYVDLISASGTPPFVDTTAIVKGSGDATKRLLFEVDGFTTATDRTLTPQNANYTIAGTNISNDFTAAQTGTVGFKLTNATSVYGDAYVAGNKVEVHRGTTGEFFHFRSQQVNYLQLMAPDGTTPMQSWDASSGPPAQIILNGHVIPGGTSMTKTLGDSAGRWNKLWVLDADISGATVLGGTLTAHGITFATDATYDIGTSSVRSATAYFHSVESGTITPKATDLYNLGATGNQFNIIRGKDFRFNGSTGLSATVTVRDAAGTGTCTLIFTAGGYTGGTC